MSGKKLAVLAFGGLCVLALLRPLQALKADSAAGQAAKTTIQLIDSTGASFEGPEITFLQGADEKQVLSVHGGKLETFGGNGATAEQAPRFYSDAAAGGIADADGVIVEFRTEAPLKTRANELARGRSKAVADAAARSQHDKVKAEQLTMKQRIETVLGKKLIPFHEKKTASAVRSRFLDEALNAVALLDVPVADTTKKLRKMRGVKSIRPNMRMQATLPDSVPMINAPAVWQNVSAQGALLDGTGMKIGVIDTGVDYTHPDLGGCLGAGCKVEGGYDFVGNDANPMDDHGHGTHVAATAAGNGTYVTSAGVSGKIPGVAPGAKIYAYKVLNSSGSGTSDAVIAGMQRCISDGNHVCTLSLGGMGNPDDYQSQIADTGAANGVVFTIAAGNSGPGANTIGSPGTSRTAITVAAACKPSQIGGSATCATPIASFSSRGPVIWTNSSGVTQTLAKPDIAAPGVAICAAEWGTAWSANRCLDGRHVAISGTSMATPHMAGVAALMRQAHPEMTPAQIKSLLMVSATTFNLDPSIQGVGLVNSLAALQASGMPNSFVRFGGLPLSVQDNPTLLVNTYQKQVQLTNTTASTITYGLSLSTQTSGARTGLDQTSITLAAGATGTVNLSVTIDHSIVPPQSQFRCDFGVASPMGSIVTPLMVYVGSKAAVQASNADLGFVFADQASWNLAQDIAVQNKLLDAPVPVDASVDCCYANNQQPKVFNATVSPASQNLAAGALGKVTLSVDGTNAPMNARYYGTLKLTAGGVTSNIPITFYKGYAVHVIGRNLPSGLPKSIIELYVDGKPGSSIGSGSLVLGALDYYQYVNTNQPLCAHAWGPTSSEWYYLAQHTGLLSQPVTEIVIDFSQATLRQTFSPVGPTGGSIFGSGTVFDLFTDHFHNTNSVTFGFTSYPYTLVTNALDRNHEVLYDLRGADSNMRPVYYTYELTNGISASQLHTNAASDVLSRDVAGYHEQAFSNPLMVWLSVGRGAMGGNGLGSSTMTSFATTPGAFKTFYEYREGAHDIARADTDFLRSSYHLSLASSYSGVDSGQVNSMPVLYKGAGYDYAWNGAYTGNSLAPAAGYLPYNPFAFDVNGQRRISVPSTNVIQIGTAPFHDSTMWYNYADRQMQLLGQRGWSGAAHEYSDGTIDANLAQAFAKTSYTLAKDGSVIASGTIRNSAGPNYSSPLSMIAAPSTIVPGNYRYEMVRPVTIREVAAQVRTVSTFKVVSESTQLITPFDENPPVLRSLQVLANGILQNAIDPAASSEIRFTVDPNPGLLARTSTGAVVGENFSRMADSIGSVSLQMSGDGGAFAPVSLTDLGGGNYSARLSSTGARLYSFVIRAQDAGGNTLEYSFQLPAGAALVLPAKGPTPTPTPTPKGTRSTPTPTPSPLPTIAPQPTLAPTSTPTPRPTSTPVPLPTSTPVPLPTSTPVPLPTSTPVPLPTSTPVPLPTSTPVPLPTSTPVPLPTATPAPLPSPTPVPDTTKPVVSITSPTNNSFVGRRGTVTIAATASDNVAVFSVEFYVNSTSVCVDFDAPYTCDWKVPSSSGKSYSITARAMDTSLNVQTSAPVVVKSK